MVLLKSYVQGTSLFMNAALCQMGCLNSRDTMWVFEWEQFKTPSMMMMVMAGS